MKRFDKKIKQNVIFIINTKAVKKNPAPKSKKSTRKKRVDKAPSAPKKPAPPKELTTKQKIFCQEYIRDWNATRAAKVAGYSEKTAEVIGYENLRKPQIQGYISEIKEKLEEQAGISRLKVLQEFMKLAFSSIAHLHNTWIDRKDFDQLTEDQKACIQEISTKIEKVPDEKGKVTNVDFVKVKLYDKQKALENICKMLGYNEADKLNITGDGLKITLYEGDTQL